MMGGLLRFAADIKMTHVPYRGQTPAITDVLAGHIPVAFTTLAGVTDMVETESFNLLAMFGQEAISSFPIRRPSWKAAIPA